MESVCLVLAVVGIRPEKGDLEDALMELQEEDIKQVSGVPVHVHPELQDENQSFEMSSSHRRATAQNLSEFVQNFEICTFKLKNYDFVSFS